MTTTGTNERRWLTVACILGAWGLFGLFFASQSALADAHAGRAVDWSRKLAAWMTCAGIWAALTPIVLWLGRRIPFVRERWARWLFVHVLAGVPVSAASLALFALVHRLWEDPARPVLTGETLRSLLALELQSNWLVYWAILGVGQVLEYYRKYRDREVAALELSSQLAQARLEALEQKLHPHFLFNTLNTISVLMYRDVPAAERVLVRLSNLLRTVLDRSESHEVRLGEELGFLRSYLEIEQVRFEDRLRVDIDVEPEALQGSVPRLLLQPLVENALRHGIAARTEGFGRVEVRAFRQNGALKLRVRDNGPGLAQGGDGPREGIGLSTTRARLERLYGAAGALELCNARDGGLEVTVTLPFRTEPVRG